MKQVFEYYNRSEQTQVDGYLYCPMCQTPMILVEIGNLARPRCPNCGFVHFHNPAPTVSILIVDRNRILLGRRTANPGKGAWAIPSGYIEYGQDFITASTQEAKEETGLDVEIQSIVNVMSSFYSPQYHFVSIYVRAEVIGGELEAGDDLSEIQWVELGQEMPQLAFMEDQEMINIYASGAYSEIPIDKGYARRAAK